MAVLAPSPDARQTRRLSGLYDYDFYSWALQQAEALKRRDFSAIDWSNVIEEIEDLGSEKKNGWEACCARAIEHMLAIEHCPQAADAILDHWANEIRNFRKQMARLIKKNPGLKGQYAEMFAEAWENGRTDAVDKLAGYDRQRGFSEKQAVRKWENALPRECPYRLEHIAAFEAESDRAPRRDIWPPAVARVLNARLAREYPILSDDAPGRGRSDGIDRSR